MTHVLSFFVDPSASTAPGALPRSVVIKFSKKARRSSSWAVKSKFPTNKVHFGSASSLASRFLSLTFSFALFPTKSTLIMRPSNSVLFASFTAHCAAS